MLENIDWSIIVALLALVFSVYTFRRTHNLAEKQAELLEDQKRLNRMLVEKEEAEARNALRADVSANLVKIGKNYKVKVFNRGKAVARNVRLVDDTADQDSFLIQSDVESKFPLENLEPQLGVELIAAIHMQSPSKLPITLIWDDDTGIDHRKTVHLTH